MSNIIGQGASKFWASVSAMAYWRQRANAEGCDAPSLSGVTVDAE